MLRSLEIRDIVLIERLTLDLGPGLNALTGETGAGKSILLDALGLALGSAGGAELLRAGAKEGSVTAVFDCHQEHPARAVLEEAGLSIVGQELILRRRVAGGRASGFVNDQRASADVIRQIGEALVEIHGQHDDRGLLNPRGHRAILDVFAGSGVVEVRSAWDRWRATTRSLREARAAAEAAQRDADFLRHAAAELAEFDPQPDEDAELDAERRLMKAAEGIRETVGRALQAMGPDQGAEGRMGDALRWLEDAAVLAEGGLEAPLAALDRALDALGQAQSGVEDALETLVWDPMRLEVVEERLFALRGLARKHRVAPEELPGLAAEFAAKVEALEGAENRIVELQAEEADAMRAYDEAAAALSALRAEAAGRLDAAVTAELPPLKLERAVFRTDLSSAEPGPEGRDRVEFLIAANPGSPPAPLAKVASGGELSRFLLALKVCLAGGDAEARTLIFDEIDRGVGGATAAAVGRRLEALSCSAQVLVVTHSPQVAARAQRQFRIEKRMSEGATRTHVSALDAPAREDEIARMLAGETVTDAAREAARALLKG